MYGLQADGGEADLAHRYWCVRPFGIRIRRGLEIECVMRKGATVCFP